MKNFKKLNFTYSIDEAITALDGRNRHKLVTLLPYFSELALNKDRILVEIRYLEKLSEIKIIPPFSLKEKKFLENIWQSFCGEDYRRLRIIELTVNHDVKAVEEFIKEKIKEGRIKSFDNGNINQMVHFGLTSEDINNLAYGLMIKGALEKVIIPEIEKIKEVLKEKTVEYKKIVMLSRTHGQPAVTTTLGKEFLVYLKRLNEELKILRSIKIKGKLTGNVGNLNVHKFLYPETNWLKFSEEFVNSIDLEPDLVTTQIIAYDSLIRVFQSLYRINNLLIGLCQDFWLYLGFSYFKQRVIEKEVGSTALPHKVNPIYFEGAEGGFNLSNALFEFYSRKLSYSRLQRDLSDSTVRRSFGIAFSYSLLSYQSVIEALSRIEPDKEKIFQDLNSHWEILSEAIQNFLRLRNYQDAYDKVKNYFRGKNLTEKEVKKFIESLKLNKKDKEILLKLSPERYTGYAEKLVDLNT